MMRAYRVSAARLLAMSISTLLVAACASDGGLPGAPGSTAQIQPSVTADEIVGDWGLGSYHRETDRDRTVKIARSQCNQAYTIESGPNGGVIMHLADQREAQELFMKGAPGGKTFVGPEGPAGDRRDREIVSFEDDVLLMTWVDPGTASRYGTMVFVRCGSPTPPRTAQRQS